VVITGTDLNFRIWPRVAWTVVANAIYHGPVRARHGGTSRGRAARSRGPTPPTKGARMTLRGTIAAIAGATKAIIVLGLVAARTVA
jgi:hypothetical protein